MLSEFEFQELLLKSKNYLESMHISIDKQFLWDCFQKLEYRLEDEIQRNIKQIKTLLLGEFVPNTKNYIYYNSEVCRLLAEHEIIVLDLLPFCVRYKTRGKAYQGLLKVCEPYYSKKIQNLREHKILISEFSLFAPYIGQYNLLIPIKDQISIFKGKKLFTWKDIDTEYHPNQARMKTRILKYIKSIKII